MANIQTLSVSIVARTQGFTRGLDLAQKRLTVFSSSMGGIARSAGRFGVVGLGAASAGLIGLTRQGFQSVDAVGDLASRLGLGVRELQGFQLAAELAGSSTGALTSGFERMEARIGQAQAGVRSAQSAFSSLGLDFQQLAAAGPGEAFRTIADRVSQLGTQTERAAAAQAIFGRGGVQLLGVLQQGRFGLEQAAEQMRRLGGVTEEGARQVDIADQHLILVNQAFQAIKQTLAQQFAPLITRSANSFIEWAQSGEGAGIRIANAFNVVLTVFAWIGKAVDFLQSAIQISAGNILKVMSKVAGFFDKDLGKRLEGSATAAFADAQANLSNVFGLESHRNVTSFFKFVEDKAEQTRKVIDPKIKLLESIQGIVGGRVRRALLLLLPTSARRYRSILRVRWWEPWGVTADSSL